MKAIQTPIPQQIQEFQSLTSEQIQQITDTLVSRKQLAARWACSIETTKRRQKQGLLRPIYLSKRQLRYRLSQIIAVERAAEGA
jgi:hypothetical protein